MAKIKNLLIAVVLLAGCSANLWGQINAEQVLSIGRNVMSMEDYMLSIQYFNQAITAKPYLSDPYFFRALAKLSLEDYKGAEEDCNLALERNKFKTDTYRLRGFVRQHMGKDSLAIEDYNVGLSYNPQDKYFLYYKGTALTELGRHKEAENIYGTLLRLYPQFEEGFAARGRDRMLSGDTIGALSDFGRVISLSPSMVSPYLLRAQIASSRKEWDKATADMDAAIRLEPNEADFYVNRAYLRYNNDDYFGAMDDYNHTLELEPRNSAALFNRALLRYEVKDLARASSDFKSVLELDPDNFHARYNLGLVDMERRKYKDALQSFDLIMKRYPRFHPVYYAKAQVFQDMGDMRTAMQHVRLGDELVRKYVKNPEKNPLDRPTIAAGRTRTETRGGGVGETEDETEVMNRFNELVTVGTEADHNQLTFNEKIKGRVQDRNLQVEPEPLMMVSMVENPDALQGRQSFFKELDEFNANRYVSDRMYLAFENRKLSEERAKELFERGEYYEKAVKSGTARGADYFALGVVRSDLKNYEAAIEAFDKAIELDPGFVAAYMMRGYARNCELSVRKKQRTEGDPTTELDRRRMARELELVAADYGKASSLNPMLAAAYYNTGTLLIEVGDYREALNQFSRVVEIDPTFGAAYYNRGLAYLRLGNKRAAFSDLSKAGELGVLPSYNLLKRMK